MEIREYMTTKRRWIAPLVAIPLLAGGAAGAAVAIQPDEFTGVTQIQTPPAQSNSDSQIGLYSAKLGQAVLSADIVGAVSAQTGLPPDDVAADLKVSRVGQSDQLSVSLTSRTEPAVLADAVRTAAQMGIQRVAERSSDNPKAAVDVGEKELSDAQTALVDFQNQIGLVPVEGESERDFSRRVVALPEDQRREMNNRQARVDAATASLADGQKQLGEYNRRIADASNGRQILQSGVVPEPRFLPVAETGAVAALVGFLAVLGLSMLSDVFRRRRPTDAKTAVPGSAEPTGTPTPAAASSASSDRPSPTKRAAPQDVLVGARSGASREHVDIDSATEKLLPVQASRD